LFAALLTVRADERVIQTGVTVPTLSSRAGMNYQNVTFTEVTPELVRFLHSAGSASLPCTALPVGTQLRTEKGLMVITKAMIEARQTQGVAQNVYVPSAAPVVSKPVQPMAMAQQQYQMRVQVWQYNEAQRQAYEASRPQVMVALPLPMHSHGYYPSPVPMLVIPQK